MKFFVAFLKRLRSYFHSAKDEQDFRDELESHLVMHTQDNIRSGLNPVEARRQAIIGLGAVSATQEAHRDRRGFAPLNAIAQDARHSARNLLRSPGFLLVASLTLAISIGATASLFSIIDATLIAPLKAGHAADLVWIEEYSPDGSTSGGTPQRLADWQGMRSFESIAGFYDEGLVMTGEGSPRRLAALRTFGSAERVLQAPLLFGRMPADKEARGLEPVVLLTARTWKAVFHGKTSILGQAVHLGGKAYPIIGVLSDDARYPEDIDVWIPAPNDIQTLSRQAGFLGQVGRLRTGVSLRSAQAEVDIVSDRLAREYPKTDQGRRARVIPLHEHVTAESRPSLLTLFAAIGSVFLVACLNVAGLLLARGLSRRREAAVRLALGAGRLRLVRLFFTEGLLLSVLGGIGGLGLASFSTELMKRLLPADIHGLSSAALDLRTTGFIGIAICLSALLCGVLPALQIASSVKVGSLNEGSRSVGGPRQRLRGTLVVAQVAASLVLLVTSGLLAESYLRMRSVPLGFIPDHALSFTVVFPWDTPPAQLNTLPAQALERLSVLPGVESAGIVDRLPLHGGSQSGPVNIRGMALPPSLQERSFGWRTATPGYFPAAGIPTLRGEIFPSSQGLAGLKVALINQRFAKMVFGSADPIGREISRRGGSSEISWFRVVGVIGDTRQKPSDLAAEPEVYVPWGATYWPIMNFVVRTIRTDSAMAREIRDCVQPLAEQQVIEAVAPLQELTNDTDADPRRRTWLLASFAAVSTSLAGIGLFGLLSQEVIRRTAEFGLRIALGASPIDLFWSTTLRGLRLVIVGLVCGAVFSLMASGLIRNLVSPSGSTNLSTYLAASIVMLLSAFVASAIPGLRAARIEPVDALRNN